MVAIVQHAWWCMLGSVFPITIATLQLVTSTMATGGPAVQVSFDFTKPVYDADIIENAVPKTEVTPRERMGINLIDSTLEVTFKITDGDRDKFFKARSRVVGDFCFLTIRTRTGVSSVINRERRDQYTLTINATASYQYGPWFSAQTQVIIHVSDANDLSPLFYPVSYHRNLPEDTALHSSVLQVSASDADIGINGEVYYSFQQKSETFAVHPTTGVVTLMRKLNYLEENEFRLDVQVQDRGPRLGRNSRVSTAPLTIRVLKVNVHAPSIEYQQLPAVGEEGIVETIYAVLYVHDEEDAADLASVSIIDGNDDGFFKLERGSINTQYNIKVAKTLDREITPYGFNLTIEAVDKGDPPKRTTRLVHVRLQDTNDHAPQFTKLEYSASIEECLPVHTPILFVQALDVDMRKNAEIKYSILEGNQHRHFAIDEKSGLLSIAAPLDVEQIDTYYLNVRAQDQGNPGNRKASQRMVVVIVLDCNDNSPVFNMTQSLVTVQEGQPAGTSITRVSAYDLDMEDNGYISYSIANVDQTPFTIDDFTGQINTKEVLDYESMKRLYRLRIRASDWGSPFRRESEMVLNVKLKDVNDNKPRFQKVDCTGYLSREAPLGTKLLVVSALDFDEGNIISYQIMSGNDDNCFELLSSSGELKTNCDLQQSLLRSDFHSLKITATDDETADEPNFADPVTINITLVNNNRNRRLANNDANFQCRDTEVNQEFEEFLLLRQDLNNEDSTTDHRDPSHFMENRHSPVFSDATPKKVTIVEGLPDDHVVVKLEAHDPDTGYNGRLMYVITSGNEGGTFKMDTYSGELFVFSTVDRETRDHYMLNVTVSDMGQPQRMAFSMLEVEVLDVNDNKPKFESPKYEKNLREDVAVGTTIMFINAKDADLAENSEITFSLLTRTDYFSIDSDTGMLLLSKELDRETQDTYRLIVKAQDGGIERSLSSTVSVTIDIDDVNDNPPEFRPSSYHVHVREDLPVGTVVMTVSAYDPDLFQGGRVQYKFQSGDDGKFIIDRLTGTIRIAEKLDFEKKQVYQITVRARDRGSPNLSSRAIIVIELIDVDENLFPPMFSDSVFEGRVSEAKPIGTSVLQLVTWDNDKINNPSATSKDHKVSYSITAGSGMGRFIIDNNGIIVTNKVLDRETQVRYWLTIYAQDHGTVPRSSMVQVMVEVQDINDNTPQTPLPVYYPSIPENSPEGTTVLRLEAYDDDDPGPEGYHITYDITSGNPQGFFQIDHNLGVITTTARKLDRENIAEHILEVTITDNGEEPLSSTTRLVINVTDENDERPRFSERTGQYSVHIPEREAGDDYVDLFRVIAFDPDLGANSDIDYDIKSGSGNGRFRINPKTGMISSQKDFAAGLQYDLAVRAVDNGRPQLKSQARVFFTVEESPDDSSDQAPKFELEGQEVVVMENEEIGHVCLVTATDEDGDKLWYSITGGNVDDTFSIWPETGDIWLARRLDWETVPDYNLTVAVTDTVNTVSTWVHIRVQDINDNRPEFSQEEYVVEINENTAPATDILTVSATDRDDNERLFYTIHSYSDKASNGKFKINSETGVITTKESLDREEIGHHGMTIMVRDQGAASKRSFAHVQIKVKDVNDHNPEFLASRFKGRVFETAALGTSVVQVMAIDRDRGTNAEIKYNIISGNVGNVFGIDNTLGVISVVKPLDRHTHSEYELVVKATDGGTPSLSNQVTVGITITVADNAPPKFDFPDYATEVEENAKVGTFILAVSATSASSITYEIVRGDDKNYFSINPNSGVIVSRVIFDYEEFSFVNLTVRATNMVGAYAHTHVVCHVIDQNDNRPIFAQEVFTGDISESAQAGSVVLDPASAPLVVKATDADTNLNSLLIYSIVEHSAQQVFEIDASTGAIKTKIELDHETMDHYDFTVQVMDMGKPSNTAEVPAKVHIQVGDVNDSPPIFTESHYVATLLLPTYPGVKVIEVSAVDLDDPPHSDLVYSILNGNAYDHFEIDQITGVISVQNTDDMLDSYALTLQVTDNVYEGESTVEIAVDRTKEAGLHFSQSEYAVRIGENSTGREQVIVVQAVGHALNEHLHFSILNPLDSFQIGETSGVIETRGGPFDREAVANYTLVVEVRDQRQPPRVAHTLVQVSITDINDNVPMFVNLPYYTTVSIDAEVGDVIRKVEAIDHDIDTNGKIVYSLLEGGDGKFDVDGRTGKITVSEQLTLEDQNKEHALVVQAEDRGNPVLRSRVEVPVTVINKATPIFSQPFYSVSIPENTPVHTAILSVEATSPTGKKLIYSINGGDLYGEFGVDFNTGSLTVIDKLEYDSESRRTYDLTVRATDTHSGAYSETIVQVQLQDVNDNAPSFSSYVYKQTVSEAVPIGTSILTVTASDDDEGPNAQLRYHIESVPGRLGDLNYFHINPERGTIFTRSKLDHETDTSLQVHVVATDSGFPALSSSSLVTVVVTDLNDNPPRFDQPSYDVTITDLVQRSQFVTIVTASDLDSSDSGNLAYSIVGGNEKQAFAINSHTGIISLSSLRRPVLEPSYILNISVTDGVYTNFARLRVTVQSSNNHVPKFDQDVYDVDIAENMKSGRLVTTVTAVDGDQGVFGKVAYAIESKEAEETFSINKDTGELYTLESLDREQMAVYTVPIVAKDGGGRAGYCVLRVNVADTGDQRPQFKLSDYQANIYVTAEVGSTVLQVAAVDSDLGSNGAITYSVHDGEGQPASEFFSIADDTGVITVKASVAHLENQLLQFFVRVTDKGSPPKDSNVPVEVYIMSPQDEPPSFVHPTHPYFVREDDPIGTVIARLTVVSNDSLIYSIVAGDLPYTNNPPKIGIDSEGIITISEALDREVLDRFELTVKAETETVPPLVAYTYVNVQVSDVNDNSPQFETSPYMVNIAENADIGSSVIQVVAHDFDSGANAAITYSFAPEDAKLSSVFAIDSETGWITTLVELDREKEDSYRFEVIATDHGTDISLMDRTTVRITINDHNDCPPQFDQADYQGTVGEDSLPGTVILRLSSSDADEPENGQVTYHITKGDPLGQFNIRRTGELFVNKMLDRETTASYQLTISATDGAFVTDVPVEVTVSDANDNAPICEEHMYQKIVQENQALNDPFARFQARDADQRRTNNARITYYLEGDYDGIFYIHKSLGYVSVRRPLDRETVSEYHLTMRAEDGGGLYCTSEVYITVTDMNDNAPVFTQSSYTVMIPEDAEISTLVTRVSATDYDLGINRRVRYAMRESDGYFSIDPDSGLISLQRTLDRESQAKFNLSIYAYDQGTPKMTSLAHLIVHLVDINDNPPEFERSVYLAEVSEAEQEGTDVVKVFATSRDTGVNAEITYSIISGNEQDKFGVDPKLGNIFIKHLLDYEMAHEFFLTIEAKDGGTPSLSNTAVVKINVTDANDNAPTFPQLVYRTQIREDVRPGVDVIQVQAIDVDNPPNSAITYSLVGGDEDAQFSIGSKDGVINVASALDRETISHYALEIHAVDSGQPQLTGTTVVNVEVTDINDTPPWFTELNYTAVIQVDESGKPSARHHTEDRDAGFGILQLYVKDDDLDPNGGPFKFDIVSGNDNNAFLIDRNGLLSTAMTFNRQIKDTYILIVRVFDNGSPPLHSDTGVLVQVIEESAFPPIVTPLSIGVTAVNDIFPGGVLGRVKAYDPDGYDTLLYEIVNDFDQLFDVQSSDGTLEAVQSLDSGNYNINVSVSDGKFVVYTEVVLRVMDISPEMAENAIVMRFANMLPEEFLQMHKTKFVNTLSSILAVSPADVNVLSIQPASNKIIAPGGRHKRATQSDLDVLVSVRKSPTSYYHSKPLRRRLANKLAQIEGALGVTIVHVINDICERDSCGDNGKCETEVHLMSDQVLPIITDKESFVTPLHALGYNCRCIPGYEGADCSLRGSVCSPSSNPCAPPKICIAENPVTYHCECPPGKTGPDCQKSLHTCTDPQCRKEDTMTFSGNSYVTWRINTPMLMRLSLSLDVKTIQDSAYLMYVGGMADYSILEIDEGVVQYRFDCGSGPGVARVTNFPINNGNWHHISVERNNRHVRVTIDDKYTADGQAPGGAEKLNVDTSQVQFGAEVRVSTEDIKNAFIGCMKDIKIDGAKLPLEGSTAVGQLRDYKDIEFHCGSYIPGVCSSNPCQNGGTCIPRDHNSYSCQCRPRFIGSQCEVDTNPCFSEPCLNNGECHNLEKGQFRCTCPGILGGPRCQKNLFCVSPNPCKHGAVCEDGLHGSICHCVIGYEGDFCEREIDECKVEPSPCQNGGTCKDLIGKYNCTCPQDYSGPQCQHNNLVPITSSSMNITIEEIIGIAAAVAAILFLVILFVIIMRCRHRRRKRRRRCRGDTATDSAEFMYDDPKHGMHAGKKDQVSNVYKMHNLPPSPRPPPVPNRPASYTPSTADSMNTLNCNLDSARNYGSAADELDIETIREPIQIPEFMKNVDAEKFSPKVGRSLPPPPAGEEPFSKHLNLDNPNIVENYPEDFKQQNKLSKTMPTEQPRLQIRGAAAAAPVNDYPPAGSNASLPISEADDLAAGKHKGKASGYHWDTSDWNPQNTPLLAITEVPAGSVRDSPTSSLRSRDSNIHIDPAEYDATDCNTDYVEEYDSEYVGDSEYAENESEVDEEDPNLMVPESPNFQEILAMQGDLNYDDDPEIMPIDYNTHPGLYLPEYSISESGQSLNDLSEGPDEYNGNSPAAAADNFAREDEDDVIHYGFPNAKGQSLAPNLRAVSGIEGYGYDTGTMSVADDMSVSMGGYTSTNASCSDLSESNLCEIEDSEVNISDEDIDPSTPMISNSHMHTDV